MPTLTPHGTRSRTAPEVRGQLCPAPGATRRAPRRLQRRLRHPVPRTQAVPLGHVLGARTPDRRASTAGPGTLAATAHAPSFHSPSSAGATAGHALTPPRRPSGRTRTRMARFSRSSPKLVRNGRTRGSATSLSSNEPQGDRRRLVMSVRRPSRHRTGRTRTRDTDDPVAASPASKHAAKARAVPRASAPAPRSGSVGRRRQRSEGIDTVVPGAGVGRSRRGSGDRGLARRLQERGRHRPGRGPAGTRRARARAARAHRSDHRTSNRSVRSPGSTGRPSRRRTPRRIATASAPSFTRFKWAFRATSGSYVHRISSTPRSRHHARWASFKATPTPRDCQGGSTASMCECRWRRGSRPAKPNTNPTVSSSTSAPMRTLPACWKARRSSGGMTWAPHTSSTSFRTRSASSSRSNGRRATPARSPAAFARSQACELDVLTGIGV